MAARTGAHFDRRHSLIASTSVQLPGRFTLGAIWTVRSALPFSAIVATTDADGIRSYVPGTSRNQGNRNLSLSAVNTYRATLGLAALTSSNIDTSRFDSSDHGSLRLGWLLDGRHPWSQHRARPLDAPLNGAGGFPPGARDS